MSASAQSITLSTDTRAEVMVTAGDEMRWDEMVEQVSRLSWSSWRIFVSSLTLSSHCSIAPLLYRTILSFIITQMSIIGPPLSCKKQMSEQQRLWPGQKIFLFLKEGRIYGTMHHILCICSSLSFPLLRLSPHRNSHRLSQTFSLGGQQTGKCFDMTEEAVQINLTNRLVGF